MSLRGGIYRRTRCAEADIVNKRTFLHDANPAFRNQSDSERVNDVFLLQNPRCECVGIVAWQNRHGRLHDDWSFVHLGAYVVDRAAGIAHACLQRAFVGMQPFECG